MKKISIIIPVYNVEQYIKNCLESVINQTYDNWEIILIDDGSTDNSKAIYENIAIKNDKIKIFKQTNKGVSAARNLGIEKAQGDYIVFLDADDWIEKKFLERMLEVIENEDADIVQCNFYYANNRSNIERKHIRPSYSIRNNMDELQLDTLYREYDEKKNHKSVGAMRGVWGKIFKSNLIKKIRFNENIDVFEDGIFVLNALQNSKKVVLIDEYYYYYWMTENSSNSKYKPSFTNTTIKIFQSISDFIDKNQKSNEFKEYFNIMVFEMISTTIDKDIFNIHSKYSKKEKIIQLKKFIEQYFCNTAIINLNTKFLNKNQKLLYRLLKIKCYTVIYYLYMIKQKTKKRKIVR